MANIGQYNSLIVNRFVDFGAYLDGGVHGEILMPKKYLPQPCAEGDTVLAFVYTDSEDRLVATTETPAAQVGQCAHLKVAAVTTVGAFLEWGLLKDLFVPYQQQKLKMEKGRWYTVYIYLDKLTNRIAASAKIEDFLDTTPSLFAPNEAVDLLVYEQTDLGYKAVINHTHTGLLYANEIFRTLRIGQHVQGFVKKVREDERIDIALQKQGFIGMDDVSKSVLNALNKSDGFLALTDNSTPESIYLALGISKKNFKKSVGILYKRRIITLEENGIRII